MHYSTEKQAVVVALKKAGHKGPEIAAQVGIPVFSVYSTLRRYEAAGTVEIPKRPQNVPDVRHL